MRTIFDTSIILADTNNYPIEEPIFVEHIDQPNDLDQNKIKVSKQDILDAFAKALDIEDASGWSTGTIIIKHLFGDK